MSRFFLNHQISTLDPPEGDPRSFHRKLPGYEVSPVVDAKGLAQRLGLGRVWIKDESSRLGLPSFKILGASWGTFRALDERIGGFGEWSGPGELRDKLNGRFSLAAATDGNHGRAVARMGRLLGLEASIFVPAGTASARIEGITSEGATCAVVDGTYEDAVARSAEAASDECLVISDTSWEGYREVPRWVSEGYSTIFNELDVQLAHAPGVVFVQMGVGALAAAAARHYRSHAQGPKMIGVEPESAACILASMEAGGIVTIPGPHDSIMAGLNCGTPSVVAWPYVSRGYDAYLVVGDERAEQGMRLLAGEGLVAGETGAAGLAGLLEVIAGGELRDQLGLGAGSTVLLLCTEGATDPAAYERIVGRTSGGVA